MIDISVQGLTKAFEVNKNILDGLSFQVQRGERVGILGKNGAGKTTLFRILVGEIVEDSGDIAIAQGARLGLISQIPRYPEGYTVEDVLKTAHRRLDEIRARMEELEEAMAAGDESSLMEYDRLMERFEHMGGYETERERNRVANGLDIPAHMRAQLFSSLSGGEKTRVNLARLILEDTDILLLDEPTNHLDMHATEWLEDYLLHFKGTVLTISHDRWFLDTVVQRTIELVHGKAEFYNGNYSFFVKEKQRRYEEQLRIWEKNQKEIAHLREAADKLHLWAFMGMDKLHKRAFSMEKRIDRLEVAKRPEREREMKARFKTRSFAGDEVLVMDNVGKSYGDKRLFRGIEMLMEGKERIALIGDNGCGKSTLLKCIVGEEIPDEGKLWQGPAIKSAYLPQLVTFQDPSRNLVDTMLYEAKCTPQQARDRLAAFGFTGEDVFKTVSCLSGGEQSRLRLCILLGDNVNFLLLDEPTNHLDLNSREWMEGALEDYDEALLFVSHDRWFIEKFAERIWELKDGQIFDFRGSFSEFRAYKARQEQLQQLTKPKEPAKKGDTRQKRGPNKERQRERAEKNIEKAEAAMAELDALIAENASDYQKLMELTEQKSRAEAELEELYALWEELAE